MTTAKRFAVSPGSGDHWRLTADRSVTESTASAQRSGPSGRALTPGHVDRATIRGNHGLLVSAEKLILTVHDEAGWLSSVANLTEGPVSTILADARFDENEIDHGSLPQAGQAIDDLQHRQVSNS